tara:strand:- start:56 stop:1069 length:1014 start_codon:yes stop_codon:yes gene_type:complete
MNKKKISVGIIGIGRIGKIHLKNLFKYFKSIKIEAISDTNEKLEILCKRYNIKKFYKSYEDLIKDKSIDAVLICSPTNMHSKQIIFAAKHKKDIFCEKPVDLSLEKTIEVLNIINKTKVKFMIGFNRRFDPDFMKIKKMVDDGKIGKVQTIKITSRDPNPPSINYIKNSGGLFIDMAIHDFDMASNIANSNVNQVYTSVNTINKKIKEAGDIDIALTTLKFENGIICSIDNSRKSVYGYDQRIEIFGSKGMCGISKKNNSNTFLINDKKIKKPFPKDFFILRYKDAYINEMKEFIDCLINDNIPSVGIKDAVKSIRIAIAVKNSYKENKKIDLKNLN